MEPPPLHEDSPKPSETLDLGQGGGGALNICEIDSVMVREWSGQWLFDIVLKNDDIVTVPATDESVKLLLEGLGFDVSAVGCLPASVDSDCNSPEQPTPPQASGKL